MPRFKVLANAASLAIGLLLAGLVDAWAQASAHAGATENVKFRSAAPGIPEVSALVLKPTSAREPLPVVVMLHGCGGLFTPSGRLLRREVDWSRRFVEAGYAVVMVDSFGSRGLGSQCTTASRAIRPRGRAGDTKAALDWIAVQPWADPQRVALIGWSNGGSTVLHAVGSAFAPQSATVRLAAVFAIYPGCRVFVDRPAPRANVPLEIHIGGADDWTAPEPCEALGKAWQVPVVVYPGAYHGFDAPDVAVRVRTGLAFTARGDGRAYVGTNPQQRDALIGAVMGRLKERFNKP